MERTGYKHLIVMGDDDMAFLFTGPSHDIEASQEEKEHEDVHSLADRLLREFKSFLPKVSRVRPVQAVFPTGEQVRLAAPQTGASWS